MSSKYRFMDKIANLRQKGDSIEMQQRIRLLVENEYPVLTHKDYLNRAEYATTQMTRIMNKIHREANKEKEYLRAKINATDSQGLKVRIID